MTTKLKTQILHEVDNLFNSETEFLKELTSHASTRGNEKSAQKFMASELVGRGYEVDSWNVNVDDIAHLPGFSPVIGNYEDAVNIIDIGLKYIGHQRQLSSPRCKVKI